jgi:eukaryotic-like serine/threonine-protein kinase
MHWPFTARHTVNRGAGDPGVTAPPLAQEADPARAHRRASWGFEEGALLCEGRRVLTRLGGGSRYEVFLAWDERLFALVVAKVLRPDQVLDERARHELEREADLLARLGHPTLVRGFGAVLDGPHPHLLLEHVEGPTLGSLIRRFGALSLDQLLPLALHLAAVLHYLGAEGIVHLDVKPGNVVMSAPPRLIDLSIARPVDRAAHLREAIGTDPYMAPEQCDPSAWPGRIGTATDVFGLGATLYHAAAGRLPFPREPGADRSADPAIRYPQLSRDPGPLPSLVPDALSRLVLRMLAREPTLRPAPDEVAATLEPLVAAVPDRLRWSRRRGLVVR